MKWHFNTIASKSKENKPFTFYIEKDTQGTEDNTRNNIQKKKCSMYIGLDGFNSIFRVPTNQNMYFSQSDFDSHCQIYFYIFK